MPLLARGSDAVDGCGLLGNSPGAGYRGVDDGEGICRGELLLLELLEDRDRDAGLVGRCGKFTSGASGGCCAGVCGEVVVAPAPGGAAG